MVDSFVSRDGSSWLPEYLSTIDASCIGCGRCFKVCSRDVMHLGGIKVSGEIIGAGDGADDDEIDRMLMIVDHPGRCIGCGACARVCPKNCQTHISSSERSRKHLFNDWFMFLGVRS
ncbi:ferredoxin III, nif-specific [Rhizobium hidalgonense]|uniref:ferredoxin III, nif-specific n=1 Tax=Rhizobium hidalgonense TaxID=1538159 RepID=UPI0009B7E9FF|nr:ferredoxin III, nif-specific [Rhizobium hidalgonense]RWX08426.1 ferredoxin III, nif-specific [Rhizobium hidalgonense]